MVLCLICFLAGLFFSEWYNLMLQIFNVFIYYASCLIPAEKPQENNSKQGKKIGFVEKE